jgi:hypothetical protein
MPRASLGFNKTGEVRGGRIAFKQTIRILLDFGIFIWIRRRGGIE